MVQLPALSEVEFTLQSRSIGDQFICQSEHLSGRRFQDGPRTLRKTASLDIELLHLTELESV